MLELYITSLLLRLGLSEQITQKATEVIILFLIMLITVFVSWGFRRLLVKLVNKAALASPMQWDDLLVTHKVISRFSWFIPIIVIKLTVDSMLNNATNLHHLITLAVRVGYIIIFARVIHALLSFCNGLYRHINKTPGSPYKGLTDALVVLVYIIAAIFITSVLTNKPILGVLSVLGGLTAVAMLVFKDTLLNLTASIQLNATDMIRVGDWIEMQAYGADGDVIETSLNTVRVQNWDKTITTIPTYALVSSSFKNWRGMLQSGGRRIKRSLLIDVTSVKFCDDALLERLEAIEILNDYLMEKTAEMESHNYLQKIDTEASVLNGRRHTNLGVFRAYVMRYLSNHPLINKAMTFLVRHQPPGPTGLPLEIYVFSNDKVWANYEALQADIFDHLLAAIPEFELRVFQEPCGSDVRAIKGLN